MATYMASGPGSDMATWSLEGDDARYFTIMGGMLEFRDSPNYEMPRGQAISATNTNTYMVTVKASAGTNMDTLDVTVMVTNEDEDGTVMLSSMTPVVGVELTATVNDPDGSVTGQSWRWMKADSATGQFADIIGATEAASASYTPVEDDASMYIKVMATYTDAEGSGKTAESLSVMVQTEAAPMTLLERYAGSDGVLQLEEVFTAIDEYFDQTGPITLEEVNQVVDLYFDQ